MDGNSILLAAQAIARMVEGRTLLGKAEGSQPPPDWRCLVPMGGASAGEVLPWLQERPGLFVIQENANDWSADVLPRGMLNPISTSTRFVGSDGNLRQALVERAFAPGRTSQSRIRQIIAAAMDLRVIAGDPFELTPAGEAFLSEWMKSRMWLFVVQLDLRPPELLRLESEVARYLEPTMDIHRPPSVRAPRWRSLISRALVVKSLDAKADTAPHQPHQHGQSDWRAGWQLTPSHRELRRRGRIRRVQLRRRQRPLLYIEPGQTGDPMSAEAAALAERVLEASRAGTVPIVVSAGAIAIKWIAYYLTETTGDLPIIVTGAVYPEDHPNPDGVRNLAAALTHSPPQRTVIVTAKPHNDGRSAMPYHRNFWWLRDEYRLPLRWPVQPIANLLGPGRSTSADPRPPLLSVPAVSGIRDLAVASLTPALGGVVIDGNARWRSPTERDWRVELALDTRRAGKPVVWTAPPGDRALGREPGLRESLESAGVEIEANLDLGVTEIRLALSLARGIEYEPTVLR